MSWYAKASIILECWIKWVLGLPAFLFRQLTGDTEKDHAETKKKLRETENKLAATNAILFETNKQLVEANRKLALSIETIRKLKKKFKVKLQRTKRLRDTPLESSGISS